MNRGPWTQTFSGGAWYPFDPRADDVSLRDIASSLGMQCRFNGHVRRFYSVAQHCVSVSEALGHISATAAMCGLLHDAAEAYIGDIVSPIKRRLEVRDSVTGVRPLRMYSVKDLEERNLAVILKRLAGIGLETYKAYAFDVSSADLAALATEMRDLLAPPPQRWDHAESSVAPWAMPLNPVGPKRARQMFLDRFHDLKLEMCE